MFVTNYPQDSIKMPQVFKSNVYGKWETIVHFLLKEISKCTTFMEEGMRKVLLPYLELTNVCVSIHGHEQFSSFFGWLGFSFSQDVDFKCNLWNGFHYRMCILEIWSFSMQLLIRMQVCFMLTKLTIWLCTYEIMSSRLAFTTLVYNIPISHWGMLHQNYI